MSIRERGRQQADTESRPFGFVLSKDTRDIINQLSDTGKPVPNIDKRQRQEIRNAKGFLNLADVGIQGLDFRNPKTSSRSDESRLARSIVLGVLCQDLYPDGSSFDRQLPYDEAVEAHRRIIDLRNPLENLLSGQISVPERIRLSQAVVTFEEIQAKIMEVIHLRR